MKKSSIVKIISLALLIVLSITGCSKKDEEASTTLTLGCGNFSDSLDPSASPNSAWGPARYGIAEGLFKFDDQMNAVPNLSDSYTVDDTRTIWKFHIRDGVSFSNGTKLTATKVVDSFEYLYNQEKNSLGTNAPSQFLVYKSISADDSTNTVTMVTAKPYANLPKVLSHVNFIIIDTNSDIATAPVGTGPYFIVKNDVGVSILLDKNQNYWNGEVPFEHLRIVFMDESTTKSLALQAGDIDMVDSITTAHDLQTLRDSKDFTVSSALSARTAFSYINFKGVLANKTLRDAILLAIDDETIAEVTVSGVYTGGHSLLPPTLDYGYDKLTDKTPYNMEKAKKMLDDAGIVDTNNNGIRELNGQELVLDYVAYVLKSLDVVAEGVTINLKELGIGTNLRVLDPDTHWNMIANGEFDLAICSWMTVPAGDPIGYLENWYSKSDINYSAYKNDKFDKLYEELISIVDTNRQKQIVEIIQQILIDDGAAMVHGYYESNLSSSNKITGVKLPMSESYWITTDIKPATKKSQE